MIDSWTLLHTQQRVLFLEWEGPAIFMSVGKGDGTVRERSFREQQ